MNDNFKSYENAFALTFFAAGLYSALHYLPLFTTAQAFAFNPDWYWKHVRSLNLMALGLRPALSAFITVEVLSLVLPPLNRWRMEGIAGRQKLNLWAWRLSFLFCFIQALGTTYLLKDLMAGHIQGSFRLFQFLTILALMGGFTLAIVLAQLITRYGLGNGFLIIILSAQIPIMVMSPISNLRDYLAGKPDGNKNFVVLAMALGLAAFSFYLWRLILRPPRFPFKTAAGKLAWFQVPPFPSSAYLQSFALSTMANTGALLALAHVSLPWLWEGWTHLAVELGAMILLGVLFYSWFWGIDLFGIQVANLPAYLKKHDRLLKAQFGSSLPLLLFGTALFWIPVGPPNFKFIYYFINFTELLWYIPLAQDLCAQWRFWKANGPGIEILELDNMALASYLKGLLEAEKVPCHFQGYRFRLVMLWLKPLFKVRLLVPEDQKERARELIAQVPYQVV